MAEDSNSDHIPFAELLASDDLKDRIAGLERLMSLIRLQFDGLQEIASGVLHSCRIAHGRAFIREIGSAKLATDDQKG